MLPMMVSEVVAYDPQWPAWFDEIRVELVGVLSDEAVIEHVGSTSVVGLAAKPLIDLDVVVSSPREVAEVTRALEEAGWAHEGNLGISGREAFTRREDLPPHHLYVVVSGNVAHRDHVDLRDYLRANPEARERYAAVKRQLSHLLADRREDYVERKGHVVQELLAEARAVG
jgi:GrpB-like predicted nucleotidyltransferase (UPF0157 family)